MPACLVAEVCLVVKTEKTRPDLHRAFTQVVVCLEEHFHVRITFDYEGPTPNRDLAYIRAEAGAAAKIQEPFGAG